MSLLKGYLLNVFLLNLSLLNVSLLKVPLISVSLLKKYLLNVSLIWNCEFCARNFTCLFQRHVWQRHNLASSHCSRFNFVVVEFAAQFLNFNFSNQNFQLLRSSSLTSTLPSWIYNFLLVPSRSFFQLQSKDIKEN